MSDPAASPEVFLRCQRVVLRPLSASDVDGPYAGWLNDPEVCRFNSHHVYPYTREQALQYVETTRKSRSEIVLAVQHIDSGRHLGNVALQAIHPIYRSADFSILMGEKSHWGQGFGLEAATALLRHGFDALALHRVGCGTSEDNDGMRKLALALGMREEGRRREAMWKRGRFVDVIEYGALASEFRNATEGSRTRGPAAG